MDTEGAAKNKYIKVCFCAYTLHLLLCAMYCAKHVNSASLHSYEIGCITILIVHLRKWRPKEV